MASGYASNIPVENAAPEPELMPGNLCIICKRRNALKDAEMCPVCTKALG